ncbi:PEP phosphonomutase family protein [Brochothrix campestris FSL F6-1037]|uniref:PEP phosphonomutase family protein n=2 Tax=Brochothrix campestris TaxID=2757 RepID=W7CYG8_9LIST|nr:PEP phosphonomutase family protein [Brochothrix campestris FSL F6-1037]
MKGADLKRAILASEGRTVCSENVVMSQPYDSNITNAEVAKSFGADLILLNAFDCIHPIVNGLGENTTNPVQQLKDLTGRPIGINLEPVDETAELLEYKTELESGRICSVATIQKAQALGVDFICLTGNPGTGVTNKEIKRAIKTVKEHFDGLVIAGKMHGAGVNESVLPDDETIDAFIASGADVILVPALGTVAGVTEQEFHVVVKKIRAAGALVMSAIGTSQESSSQHVIEEIALKNKMAGVDIQHIGDAGVGGMAPPQNIFALSVAIRGLRHTVSMMARSIKR